MREVQKIAEAVLINVIKGRAWLGFYDAALESNCQAANPTSVAPPVNP